MKLLKSNNTLSEQSLLIEASEVVLEQAKTLMETILSPASTTERKITSFLLLSEIINLMDDLKTDSNPPPLKELGNIFDRVFGQQKAAS